jgi:putative membrane protein
MKRINYKKRAVIHGLSMAVFLGACLGVQASGDDKGVSAQATVNADRSATSSSDRNSDNSKLSRADANFVKEAAQGGLKEVKMGQVAKDRGASPEVKAYGEMLVKEHSKANEKLTQIATSKGVNLAKEIEHKHNDMMKDMEAKQGQDFDRMFIEHAVKDHKKDVAKFEKASRDLQDSELKAFAMETLPKLQAHLAEAQRIAKSLGVNISAADTSEYHGAEHNAASVSAAGSAGSPGLSTSERNSSVNRVDVDIDRTRDASAQGKIEVNTDKSDGKTLGVDLDRGRNADAEVKVEADTDKGDGKILGVEAKKDDGKILGIETKAGDDRTLGVETKKSDDRVLGVETRPGDGKTVGLNTRKDDGKLLGILPAPGRNKAENRVDVDVDNSDHSVEVNASANRDTDAAIGAPAGSEKGASAKVDVKADKSGNKTLSYNEAPQKVQDTIKAQGGSSDVKVQKHQMNGKTAYKAKINGRELHIAEDGTIIKDRK